MTSSSFRRRRELLVGFMCSTESARAFAIFGWELKLDSLAALYVPVQPPPGSKPAFRFDPNARGIGNAEIELWRLLKSLTAPLDARIALLC